MNKSSQLKYEKNPESDTVMSNLFSESVRFYGTFSRRSNFVCQKNSLESGWNSSQSQPGRPGEIYQKREAPVGTERVDRSKLCKLRLNDLSVSNI